MSAVRIGAIATRLLVGSAAGEFFAFALSGAAYQASRLLVSLWAASLLAPGEYAQWGVALAVLAVTTHATLGALSGANRALPIRLGARDEEGASRIESLAAGSSLITAAVIVAGSLAVIPVVAAPAAPFVAALGIAAASQQLNLASQVSLRGRLEFHRASGQQVLAAVTFAAVGIPLVIAAGVVGLLLAQAFVFAFAAALVWWLWRRAVRPLADLSGLLALARDGLPIMLAGLVYAVLITADRWVILTLGEQDELGVYSFAAIVASVVLFVTLLLAQQTYPRLARRYGELGLGRELMVDATRQSLLALVAGVAISVGLFLAAETFLRDYFPAYAGAAAIVGILGLGYAALAAGSGYANLLNAVGRSTLYLAIQCTGCAVLLAGALVAFQLGLGPRGVAVALLIACSLVSMLVTLAALSVGRVRGHEG